MSRLAVRNFTWLGLSLLGCRAFSAGLHMCSSSAHASFEYKDLQVTLTKTPQPKPDSSKLVFGHHFSDHMLTVDWSASQGWGKPDIRPVEELRLHPAAKVLHYAVELFEGMKAFRCEDNRIRMFRPTENMKRMLTTAQRCCLPTFDGQQLSRCIKKLISIDSEWVPDMDRCSLYIRPALIGTQPTLGVSTSKSAMLFVLTGPVGPYFPTGFKPVTLLADPQYVRAYPGGCGAYKMGANYAPTIHIQDYAIREEGCQQVLWLYGKDHMITEAGTMNIFVYWINVDGEEELLTPPLNGLILPGITRKSLLELAAEWREFNVCERDMTMREFTKALSENRVKEVFGTGTACVVCPVEKIKYMGQTLDIPTMKEAKVTSRFYKQLTDIQAAWRVNEGRKGANTDARVERRTQLGASLGEKTSKRTEKEKLLEEEIVEEPPASRRVNPQKRVLEKTRQKSVGPAEKRQKLTVTVVAEIHHSEEQQVPSQQQPEREAVESVDTCISKSSLTSKPKQSTLTTFFQKHV